LTSALVSHVTPPDHFSYLHSAAHAVDPKALAPCLRAMAALERGGELVSVDKG